MAKYLVQSTMFVAPTLIPAGSVIEYNGPPGPHLEPLDDHAKAAMDIYYKENPHASLNPVDQLPKTMEPVPTVTILKAPGPTGDVAGLGNLAAPGKALPEGTILEPLKVGPGPIVQTDPPGVGSNAKSIVGADPADKTGLPNSLPDNPAMGDPTKPGGKGAEKKEEADQANADATAAAQGKPSLKI